MRLTILFIFALASADDFEFNSNTLPEKYELTLRTSIHDGSSAFSGSVKITIRVLAEVNSIVLHSKDLKIESVKLLKNRQLEDINFVNNTEALRMDFSEELSVGIYEIEIKFSGEFSKKFVSSYLLNDESEVYFAVINSKLSPFYTLCPCYDEFDAKSLFTIKIEHHSSYHVITNLPADTLMSEQISDDYEISVFNSEKKLPPSSIGIIISKFKSITSEDVHVYGRDDHVAAGYLNYSLVATKKIHDELKTFFNFDIRHSIQVAVPNLLSGTIALSNLIIYDQYLLLHYENSTTTKRKNEILRNLIEANIVSSLKFFIKF
jgi:aminopeptidase N